MGLEPTTFGLKGRHSNQLSYEGKKCSASCTIYICSYAFRFIYCLSKHYISNKKFPIRGIEPRLLGWKPSILAVRRYRNVHSVGIEPTQLALADLKPAALTTRPTVQYVLLPYHILLSYYFSFFFIYVFCICIWYLRGRRRSRRRGRSHRLGVVVAQEALEVEDGQLLAGREIGCEVEEGG